MNILRRNWINQAGPPDGPVVLLAHGLGCDQRFWNALVARLKNRYRLILFDYVGSGNSLREAYDPQRYGHLDGYRDDLLDVRGALDLNRVHLVGHSISSMIGMLACLREPQHFQTLSMVAPSPRFLNDAQSGYLGGFEKTELDEYLQVMDQNFIGWATAFAQIAAGPDIQAERELFESFCSTDSRTIRKFAELALYVDLRHLLCNLRTRTLILQCRHDNLAPLSVGDYLRTQIPAAEYAELDVVGHCPHVTHPDLVCSHLEQFWRT